MSRLPFLLGPPFVDNNLIDNGATIWRAKKISPHQLANNPNKVPAEI
ncbi:8174_t:CDS:2, partial [Cetraspora pellucida]